MTEFVLQYQAKVVEFSIATETDDDVRLRFGVGGSIDHREARLDLQDSDTTTGGRQTIDMKDNGIFYILGRFRMDYAAVGLQLDWYVAPNTQFGGDFEGVMNDVEIVALYTLDPQDLTFRVGYRWTQLPASGNEGGLEYDVDYLLEGWEFGIEFTF
jgi:hypothetical protein